MKFKNTTGKMKIVRFGWNTFKDVLPNEVIDIPMEQGLNMNFSLLRDGVELKGEAEKAICPDCGGTNVHYKDGCLDCKEKLDGIEAIDVSAKDNKDFKTDVLNIKGIGVKTAKDILGEYKTEEELKIAFASGDRMPFRDDVVEKLRKRFMGD